MASLEHFNAIKQGVEFWNKWRENRIGQKFDLSRADLSRANLSGANFSGVNLSEANLSGSNFSEADLRGADLRGAFLIEAYFDGANLSGAKLNPAILIRADLRGATLSGADLSRATLSGANIIADLRGATLSGAYFDGATLSGSNFSGANLIEANLVEANLIGANLSRANLSRANLIRADLSGADLSGANLSGAKLNRAVLVEVNIDQAKLDDARIYGVSVWNLKGLPKSQSNLIITREDESTITVDDLLVAQFVYLLLNNRNIRNVIDTITSKAVLILGRFTDERKAVLDAISKALRERNYLPIIFIFDGPQNRDKTETIRTLAHMAKFIVADITNPRCIPQELMTIVPNLPSVPVQPLLLDSQSEYDMFQDLRRYPWVLDTCYYEDVVSLLNSIEERVIHPAETYLKDSK